MKTANLLYEEEPDVRRCTYENTAGTETYVHLRSFKSVFDVYLSAVCFRFDVNACMVKLVS